MKNLFYLLILITATSILSGCATIVGGKNYYARVQVPNHPNAKIEYKGTYQGTGEATFKAKRRDANNFAVTIKEDGCKTQTKVFTKRQFRGWSFVGTVLGWTSIISTAPYILPWGIAIDAGTGAWWKPDINEKGVAKQDYNHYLYSIDYTGCEKGVE